MIQIRESMSHVHVCESCALPLFNQSLGGSFPSYTISVAFSRWNFLLHAAKKNNKIMSCEQLQTKTRTSISRKIRSIKSGFQILYSVEQFSPMFSKNKLKQGAHVHQTHDPPSPHMLWENCHTIPSQQLPHVLCGAST